MQSAIDGYTNFIKEQKEEPGLAKITLCTFDDRFERLWEGVLIESSKELTLKDVRPRGYTALYDAIGKTVFEQSARIEKEAWADQVIVVITTDGHENASKEYNLKGIRALIDQKSEENWKFIFLAANIDADAVGSQLGVKPEFTQSYTATAAGTTAGYAKMNRVVKGLRN